MTYSYSTDQERFYGKFASVEEALEEVKENYGDGKEVYIGKNGVFYPFVDGDSIIASIQQQADDQMGETAGYYLEGIGSEKINELSAILTKAFNEWSEKYGYKCKCHPVDNIKKYTVGEATK